MSRIHSSKNPNNIKISSMQNVINLDHYKPSRGLKRQTIKSQQAGFMQDRDKVDEAGHRQLNNTGDFASLDQSHNANTSMECTPKLKNKTAMSTLMNQGFDRSKDRTKTIPLSKLSKQSRNYRNATADMNQQKPSTFIDMK